MARRNAPKLDPDFQKMQRVLDMLDSMDARVKQELEAAKERDFEKLLLAHPMADSLEIQKIIAALRGIDDTVAGRRRAEIIRLSLDGVPVKQIAAEVGLAYYYVVQLRARLGLSKPRRKR